MIVVQTKYESIYRTWIIWAETAIIAFYEQGCQYLSLRWHSYVKGLYMFCHAVTVCWSDNIIFLLSILCLKKTLCNFCLLNVIILNDMMPLGFWRINSFSCEKVSLVIFRNVSFSLATKTMNYLHLKHVRIICVG